jgi:hypothetical protein
MRTVFTLDGVCRLECNVPDLIYLVIRIIMTFRHEGGAHSVACNHLC